MSQENFVIYGQPCLIDYTDNKTLGEFVLKSLKANGNGCAIIDGVTGESITYDRLLDRALTLVKYLQGKGIGIGDTIGLCCENRIEFPIVVFATIFCGASLSTINPRYVNREIKHVVDLVTPKIIFVTSSTTKSILEVCKDASFVREIIEIGQSSSIQAAAGIQRLNDILLNDPMYKMDEKELKLQVFDKTQNEAFILMSSGTTGLPKGVVLTDLNILESLAFAEETRRSMYTVTNAVSLGILPWFHTYGLMTLIGLITKGVKFVCLPRFEEKTFLNALQTYKITHASLVPPLMVFLAKNPNVLKYDLSNLRELYYGAAPLGKETEIEVKQRIPNLTKVQQGYGLTEATLTVLGIRDLAPIGGSVGKVTAKTWCKVLDVETGEILGPNKSGELCFKGPSIMKGYYRNTQATKETIKDGWLHTGDIGYYDENLNFYIVDRLKELIKYNGFQVAPAELEALLLTHPAVKDAAVIGQPNVQTGELPTGFVVLKDNYEASEEEITNFIADRVSNPKKLRGGIYFVKEIPKNPSGKILRRILREMIVEPKSKL
uniref:Luciferin 4-monooxygenase n=1 Tax=Nyssomyia neivai TaxID=330878 RepID=A0A1L8DZ07_9DIPT